MPIDTDKENRRDQRGTTALVVIAIMGAMLLAPGGIVAPIRLLAR